MNNYTLLKEKLMQSLLKGEQKGRNSLSSSIDNVSSSSRKKLLKLVRKICDKFFVVSRILTYFLKELDLKLMETNPIPIKLIENEVLFKKGRQSFY